MYWYSILFRWNAWWFTRTTRRRPLRTTSRSSNWKTRSRDNPTLSPFVCQGGHLIEMLTISMPSSHFHSYSTSSSHAAISIVVGVITVCLLLGITTRSSWMQWELSLDGDDLNMVGDQVNINIEILINSYDLSVIADFFILTFFRRWRSKHPSPSLGAGYRQWQLPRHVHHFGFVINDLDFELIVRSW